METAIWLIFAGLVLLDLKVLKIAFEQTRHNKEVERLLGEVRNRGDQVTSADRSERPAVSERPTAANGRSAAVAAVN